MILVLFALIPAVMVANASVWAQDAEKININTAGQEELVKLDKVGPKTADKIIAYREAKGPFEKPEDIVLVKGVGDKIFEMNKDRIVVE
jgi:competence protein ComEA